MEGKSRYNIGDRVFILNEKKDIEEHEVTSVAMIFTKHCSYITYWLDNPGYPTEIVKDELECFADKSELEEYLSMTNAE